MVCVSSLTAVFAFGGEGENSNRFAYKRKGKGKEDPGRRGRSCFCQSRAKMLKITTTRRDELR